jgi:hypothetical protein
VQIFLIWQEGQNNKSIFQVTIHPFRAVGCTINVLLS